jgi:hypothetical protein
MGRSVSRPSGSIVCYDDVSKLGYVKICPECDCTSYDNVCDNCGHDISSVDFAYDEGQADCDFEWYIENLTESLIKKYPTLSSCDKWLDREDHAILENDKSYVGISEYCGLLSIWMVAKDDESGAERYVKAREKSFVNSFGSLRKIGTFSNGEGVYERKAS